MGHCSTLQGLGGVCTIFPSQGGRPSDLRAQAVGVQAPVDGQLQGPSDCSRSHKEKGGLRQRPGMAQIGGLW